MKRTLFRPLALPVLLPALMLCLPLHARGGRGQRLRR